MDINEYKQIANLIRDNDIYKVYDLNTLEGLMVSLTELNPQKSTTGHSHNDADEVYFFIEGNGVIEVGRQSFKVKSNDIILVPRGEFHKVYNLGEKILRFWSIFEKYSGRGK
jgi:mannose-6-phosphate isomerase-like protein (cupin superfamily)